MNIFCISIAKLNNLSYLSWASKLNISCFRACALVLVLMLYILYMAGAPFLSVGPAVFDCTADLAASTVACIIDWIIACVFLIFFFLCESVLLGLPSISLPY